ncbi:adenylate/guanylate cyclase domain-containing protein [Methylobacterium trifolii]|uniref:Adenylate/guanylate cyclase domain-containing protein n=1 Tax=Methylobacterium trifolii TaxID=1003092 RepID=A0ABQ4U4X3_9HYPH|nr:adenylate/guanylate cyclase domain-containing protein [Methylobacterium trifolii]GJE62470.1 hypothetical protein MPOCJGCO_4603 [Methylobacterium trifolii]
MVGETPVPVGILFCDVVGSTRLYRDLGDDRAHAIVTGCLGEVGRQITARGGRVVKTIGDEIMAVFTDAPATFDAAVAIQTGLSGGARVPATGGDGIRFRIGFHCGPVVVAGGDVFGTTVNVAARMACLAKADQIITTVATVAQLSAPQQAATRPIVGAHARGLAEDVGVAEVIWQDSAMQTVVFAGRPADEAAATALKILRGGRRWTFDRDDAGVTLGRAADNTIVVGDQQASRRHATIERRRDKWVLVDHSTNGTFVRPVGAAEFRICREEVVLHAAGTISLGHALDGDREGGIDFVLNASA